MRRPSDGVCAVASDRAKYLKGKSAALLRVCRGKGFVKEAEAVRVDRGEDLFDSGTFFLKPTHIFLG